MNVSRAVSFIVNQQPPLSEMLARGLANYPAVAAAILPDVERHIGSEASQQAVVMALRRLAERLTLQDAIPFDFHSEIIMKSPLCDIVVEWSPQLAGILRELYKAVDIKQGDTLHLIHGNYEVSIIPNEKHKGMMLKRLAGHPILRRVHVFEFGKLRKQTLKLASERIIDIIRHIRRIVDMIGIS